MKSTHVWAIALGLAQIPSVFAQHPGDLAETLRERLREQRAAASAASGEEKTSTSVASNIHKTLSEAAKFGSCRVESQFSPPKQGRDDRAARLSVLAKTESGISLYVEFDLEDTAQFSVDEVTRTTFLKTSQTRACDHQGCVERSETWITLMDYGSARSMTLMRMSGHSNKQKWEMERVDC